ncbi:MAG: TatD family hydrolase [Candidatus Omnitrophica bacterium]|nr:TatD family hydrolase [Candidatus Omnitrophota bacterium]
MECLFQDSHIHIQDIKSLESITRFIQDAKTSGWGRFFNCAITPADWPIIKAMAEKDAALVPFFGIHPWFSDLADEKSFQQLEAYLSIPGAFAGEMGPDKARKNIDFSLQKDIFTRQLLLAKKFKKPFTVHCVRAWEETISLIKSHAPDLRFLTHSFNGSHEIAQEIQLMGGFFSVSIKEFIRDENPFKSVFKILPSNRILLETDFPYQVKWTTPQEYIKTVHKGYEIAASWRDCDTDTFIKGVYDNGTIFTHGTSDR